MLALSCVGLGLFRDDTFTQHPRRLHHFDLQSLKYGVDVGYVMRIRKCASSFEMDLGKSETNPTSYCRQLGRVEAVALGGGGG